MSDIKFKDLSPAPFLARFLEDQFARPLTEAEMKAVRGGLGKDPRLQDNVMPVEPDGGPGSSPGGWPIAPGEPYPGMPGMPPGLPSWPWSPCGKAPVTTMAYPSDGVAL